MEDIGLGWVDLLIATMLIIGITRGRKRGMSEEVLSLLKWMLIVAVGSFCYEPIGGIISSSTPFSRLTGYMTSYLAVIAGFTLLFAFLSRHLGGKIAGSDAFGGAEYYLGMCAGGLRYLCIVLVVLALLHARYYSPADIQREHQKQIDAFGSDFFPNLCKMQRAVFEDSLSGRFLQGHVPILLIKATSPEDKGLPGAKIIRARESEVYEVLDK